MLAANGRATRGLRIASIVNVPLNTNSQTVLTLFPNVCLPQTRSLTVPDVFSGLPLAMVLHKAIAEVISIFGTVRITVSHRAGLRAIVRECFCRITNAYTRYLVNNIPQRQKKHQLTPFFKTIEPLASGSIQFRYNFVSQAPRLQ